MRNLSANELKIISGAGDLGRDTAQVVGGLAGNFVGGPLGAAAGTVAGGAVYDYASTHTAPPAMSPSGLGGYLGGSPFSGSSSTSSSSSGS
ncbi:colicin [Salmonella enterica]|nr:colicin [Salmonella enterica]EBI7664405.1 colicin [Salmonella enterica]EHR6361714.1 colicin V family bacteriocin [Salmonella enterica]EHR7764120.1 colicin V family bacteriocin [Salmonella enterica]EIY5616526.1 colicin V family bacteriocin [Salmonella enterica]